MAEAMTACRAVVFAQELSLSKVVVEGDCLQVVTTLNASDCCKTMYGNVVEETRRQARRLQQCQFQHVRWEGNKLVHALTRREVSSTNCDIWIEKLPSDLEDVF